MSELSTLALDDITVRYDGATAVEGISFSVGEGEWVAVIGPNGAGKSSLLRAVTNLTRHTGTVRVQGLVTSELSWRRRGQLLASVPQQPEIPSTMTVFDYVLLGRTPHLGPFAGESAGDRRRCAELLHRLELLHLADRALLTLSGGELQRTVMARALAQDAPVLLLDEPTSALDLGHRVDVLELVDDLRRERGLAVLSVMHDLTLAAQFADRLVLLSEGRLVAIGAPAAVLDEKVLSGCFGGQVRVLHDPEGGLLVAPQRRARS